MWHAVNIKKINIYTYIFSSSHFVDTNSTGTHFNKPNFIFQTSIRLHNMQSCKLNRSNAVTHTILGEPTTRMGGRVPD
jgi:hypothetical protein